MIIREPVRSQFGPNPKKEIPCSAWKRHWPGSLLQLGHKRRVTISFGYPACAHLCFCRGRTRSRRSRPTMNTSMDDGQLPKTKTFAVNPSHQDEASRGSTAAVRSAPTKTSGTPGCLIGGCGSAKPPKSTGRNCKQFPKGSNDARVENISQFIGQAGHYQNITAF